MFFILDSWAFKSKLTLSVAGTNFNRVQCIGSRLAINRQATLWSSNLLMEMEKQVPFCDDND